MVVWEEARDEDLEHGEGVGDVVGHAVCEEQEAGGAGGGEVVARGRLELEEVEDAEGEDEGGEAPVGVWRVMVEREPEEGDQRGGERDAEEEALFADGCEGTAAVGVEGGVAGELAGVGEFGLVQFVQVVEVEFEGGFQV